MFDLSASAWRLYDRLLGPRSENGTSEPAEPTEADGLSAVLALEATISGAEKGPARRPGGLAAALALASTGHRSTAFLSTADLLASLNLLSRAARGHLPLVVHVVCDSHEAYHAAAASGAVLLFASDAQDAIDLTLVGRRLAEDALVPVVLAMDGPETAFSTRQVRLPSADASDRFLGRSGDLVHPATPSQAILFGKHRRRVPRWHDPEQPLLHGARLGPEAFPLAGAARHAFFDVHLPELLARTVVAFSEETGCRKEPLDARGVAGARYLVLTQGAAAATAEGVAERLREDGIAVGVVGLRALRPFPAAGLLELLHGCRGVFVLERVNPSALASAPLMSEVRAFLGEKIPPLASVLYGQGGSPLHVADLEALVRELTRRGARWHDATRCSPVYLGFDMAGVAAKETTHPKRQALLDALRRSYPEIVHLGARNGDAREAAEDPEEGSAVGEGMEPSPAVRRMGRSSSPLTDLPGFWDRVGTFYRAGKTADLMPDPFLATETLPPFSSALVSSTSVPTSGLSTSVPAFDPTLCTGCGACWTACPDAAVGPVVIGSAALLDLGMKKARLRGHSVDKLRRVTSKLASRVELKMAADGWNGGPAGPLFDAAFEDVHQPDLRKAYEAVRREIADLAVARTDPFFDRAPKLERQLFSLALDPEACKDCGLCVAACEPGALSRPGSPADGARALWRLCEELPEPDDATLERARDHPDVGPLAGALLSRQARDVMAGGHRAEPGSGPALALRQVLGAAAYHLHPVFRLQVEEIASLKTRLAAAIHEGLAGALPDQDLAALARGLDAFHQPEADLAELTARVETAFESQRVDIARTRRLVDAARLVADLAWRFETGGGGLGRAPLSLVLAGPELAWAATFPHNPFRVPVTLDSTGDAADLVCGLLEGQRRETVEIVRVLRRARLELDRPRAGHREALEALVWNDLSREEQRICPPLFLAMTEGAYQNQTLAALRRLYQAAPIKIILLSHETAEDRRFSRHGYLLDGVAKTLFVQSSVAHFSHLEQGLRQALDHDGPAILRILAPSPALGGFASDEMLGQARAAVESGAFPLLIRVEAETGDARPGPEIAALEQRHAGEIAALRHEYETRLTSERAGLRDEATQQVRERLMRIAGGRT